MHLAKTVTYSRFAAMTMSDLFRGGALGGSLILGSWTGRKLIDKIPEKGFSLLVEVLLVLSAASLILS